MFCQYVNREELHNIEYMNKSIQMMEDASLDPVIRVPLMSRISDLLNIRNKRSSRCSGEI